MMPVAIGLLWIETGLFSKLFVAPEREAPLAFGTAVPRERTRPGRTSIGFQKGQPKVNATH